MATTVARSKAQVDEMTPRERLWDSLNYSYGKKRENSDEQFRKAYSQADRQMLSRGMQRSAYGAQTLANLDKQRVDAQNDIFDNQIADYENRLYQIEQDERAQDQWERQFAEGQRQFNTNLEFQAGEAAKNRAFQTSEREATQKYQAGENALNRAFQTSEREAQQKYNTGEREAQQNWQAEQNALARAFQTSEREAQQNFSTSERIAQQFYNTSEREAQQQYQSGENALAREFQAAQNAQNQAWQSGENALNRAQDQAQFDANLAYNRERAGVADEQWQQQFAEAQKNTAWQQEFSQRQWEAQQEQWRQTFDYNKMSDTQKIAYNYVMAALERGTDVTDDLLAKAGLTRRDFDAMKGTASAIAASGGSGSGGGGGGSGSGSGSTNKGTTPPPASDSSMDSLLGSQGGANFSRGGECIRHPEEGHVEQCFEQEKVIVEGTQWQTFFRTL